MGLYKAAGSVAELEKILVDAREGNARPHITGVLVYVDGVFLQVLEGEKDAILGLLQSIRSDTLHSSLKVIHEADVEAPTFSNWTMAYLAASPEQLAVWAGLEGTASMESILQRMQGQAQRVSQVVETLFRALTP